MSTTSWVAQYEESGSEDLWNAPLERGGLVWALRAQAGLGKHLCGGSMGCSRKVLLEPKSGEE